MNYIGKVLMEFYNLKFKYQNFEKQGKSMLFKMGTMQTFYPFGLFQMNNDLPKLNN